MSLKADGQIELRGAAVVQRGADGSVTTGGREGVPAGTAS
jgi:hypothetical protein